jgi:hypothetical protein
MNLAPIHATPIDADFGQPMTVRQQIELERHRDYMAMQEQAELEHLIECQTMRAGRSQRLSNQADW